MKILSKVKVRTILTRRTEFVLRQNVFLPQVRGTRGSKEGEDTKTWKQRITWYILKRKHHFVNRNCLYVDEKIKWSKHKKFTCTI